MADYQGIEKLNAKLDAERAVAHTMTRATLIRICRELGACSPGLKFLESLPGNPEECLAIDAWHACGDTGHLCWLAGIDDTFDTTDDVREELSWVEVTREPQFRGAWAAVKAQIFVEYIDSPDRANRIYVADDFDVEDGSRYVLQFGAYGGTRVLASGHLGGALESAAARLLEVAPSPFCDTEVAEEYERLVAAAREEGIDVDDESVNDRLHTAAEIDTTFTESGRLRSHEWTYTLENAAFDEIRAHADGK